MCYHDLLKRIAEIVEEEDINVPETNEREKIGKMLYGDQNYSKSLLDKKIEDIKSILQNSPYKSMSELFKKVLVHVVLKTNYDRYDFVEVDDKTVGLIVGIKGGTIKYIQDISTTKIITPSRDMQPIFTIVGRMESVKMAKLTIISYSQSIIPSKLKTYKIKPNVHAKPGFFKRNHSLQYIDKNVGMESQGYLYQKIRRYSYGGHPDEWVSTVPTPQFRTMNKSRKNLVGESEEVEHGDYLPHIFSKEIFSSDPTTENQCYQEYNQFPQWKGLKTQLNNMHFNECENVKTTTLNALSRNKIARRGLRYVTYPFQTSTIGSPFCMMCYGTEDFTMLMPCKNGPFCRNCATKIIENKSNCPICDFKVETLETWNKL